MTDTVPCFGNGKPIPAAIFDGVLAWVIRNKPGDSMPATERALILICGWYKFSSNSVDERGHESCRDWVDPELVLLLDQDLDVEYGITQEHKDIVAKESALHLRWTTEQLAKGRPHSELTWANCMRECGYER